MTVAPGTPCWIDLSSPDRDAAIAFYSALFGWTSTAPNADFGGYVNFLLDGRVVAGLMDSNATGGAPGWTTWLATPDCDATVAAVWEAGGKVVFGPDTVGDLGVMAGIVDPSGAFVGLWQAGEHKGFDPSRPLHGPMWHEVWTRDVKKVVAFHKRLFDSAPEVVQDAVDFQYTVIRPAGDPVTRIGVTDASRWMPADAPPFWHVYFRVADIHGIAARAVALGGAVIEAPADTPYGWMGTLADPQGVQFRIMDPKPIA